MCGIYVCVCTQNVRSNQLFYMKLGQIGKCGGESENNRVAVMKINQYTRIASLLYHF